MSGSVETPGDGSESRSLDPKMAKAKKQMQKELSAGLNGKAVIGEDGPKPTGCHNFVLRNPQGCRDFDPSEMAIREKVFKIITDCFKLHDAVTIDTPVFELKELLTNTYAEDTRLICDLADQDGELLSLRYDLLVPLARYLAMNRITNIKRYQIAKVYLRDQMSAAEGRIYEFYQCSFDISGKYAPMVPDAELLTVVVDILHKLHIGPFTVKVNHRKILDAVMEQCRVPPHMFRTICSSIDKLDKSSWTDVRDEMITEKHLDPAVADHIQNYV